jgi:hypothetical protein
MEVAFAGVLCNRFLFQEIVKHQSGIKKNKMSREFVIRTAPQFFSVYEYGRYMDEIKGGHLESVIFVDEMLTSLRKGGPISRGDRYCSGERIFKYRTMAT